MTKIAATLLILLFTISNALAYPIEKLFYLTPDISDSFFSEEQLQQIENHAKSIDIVAPQIYQMNENGNILGILDLKFLKLAKKNNLKVMPLIINFNFDQKLFHHFLL